MLKTTTNCTLSDNGRSSEFYGYWKMCLSPIDSWTSINIYKFPKHIFSKIILPKKVRIYPLLRISDSRLQYMGFTFWIALYLMKQTSEYIPLPLCVQKLLSCRSWDDNVNCTFHVALIRMSRQLFLMCFLYHKSNYSISLQPLNSKSNYLIAFLGHILHTSTNVKSKLCKTLP